MKPLPAIYLASQSPRRQQLLTQIGVSFELLLPSDPNEAEALENVLPGEDPENYVCRVTRLKLQAALARLKERQGPSRPVLCADTTVALRGEIMGKPRHAKHALAMLTQLSGRTHQVLTAVALGEGRRVQLRVQVSQVTFAPLRAEDLKAYVKSGEPMGKAGAYGIQGMAASFVKSIQGSHSGIMGLPLYETHQLLSHWVKE
jgi:septum formation protein